MPRQLFEISRRTNDYERFEMETLIAQAMIISATSEVVFMRDSV